MPSFDLTKKTLRYTKADETIVEKAAQLLGIMAEHDPAAKQDSNTALTSLKALQKHLAGKRTPAETPAAK